jgi:hypothetical protein
LLPTFAFALEVGAGPEHDVSTSEVNELGDPQSSLDREQQECAIPSADPGGDVRRRQHHVDFSACEIGDRTTLMPLHWDGQNPTAAIEVRRFADRHVSKEGVNRGEPDIARAH